MKSTKRGKGLGKRQRQQQEKENNDTKSPSPKPPKKKKKKRSKKEKDTTSQDEMSQDNTGRPPLKMVIQSTVYDEEQREMERQELEEEEEARAANKKADEEERSESTLATFSWKDRHNKLFFHHYKIENDKYLKKKGKMKKYHMWEKLEDAIKNKLLDNGEDFFPTGKQCESHWKHMKLMYHKQKLATKGDGSGQGRASVTYYDDMHELIGDQPCSSPKRTMSTSLCSSMAEANESTSSTSSSSSSSSTSSKSEKRGKHYVTAAESSSKAILTFMKAYEDRRKEQEEKKLAMVERLHKEKCSLIKDLISVLKKEDNTATGSQDEQESDDDE